jgi:hypothetical protein
VKAGRSRQRTTSSTPASATTPVAAITPRAHRHVSAQNRVLHPLRHSLWAAAAPRNMERWEPAHRPGRWDSAACEKTVIGKCAAPTTGPFTDN